LQHVSGRCFEKTRGRCSIAIKDGTITKSQSHIEFAAIVNMTASVLLTIPIMTEVTFELFPRIICTTTKTTQPMIYLSLAYNPLLQENAVLQTSANIFSKI
jgi:hypothetical protein